MEVRRLVGLDHERLTNRHAGRDFHLTDMKGFVANPLSRHKPNTIRWQKLE